MSNNIPIVTVNELHTLNWGKYFYCSDELVFAEKTVYGIANSYVPDHTLTCSIPLEYRKTYPHKNVKVQVHILWLSENDPFGYIGLVVDKNDLCLHWLEVTVRPSHNTHHCAFRPASLEQIMERAVEHNPFLNHVVDRAMHCREQLLDFQIYSHMSDRFYYMEIPFEDKVVMCGAGLHKKELLKVGLVGKALNKDFFVSYAECTPEAYERLKAQCPSLYDRGSQMEKNRPFFSYINVFFEKRKKYSELADILLSFRKEPLSTRNVSFFSASPNGTKMHPYHGPAYRWMEDFIIKYQRIFK